MAHASDRVMHSSTWTPESIETLRGLAAQQFTASEIAAKLSLTRSAIIGKMRREGIAFQSGRAGRPRKNQWKRPNRGGVSTEARRILRSAVTGFDRPPTQPIEKFKPRAAKDVKPLLVSFGDLASGHCRWPYGDKPPFLFCGCLTGGDRPYCTGHSKLARSGG
jgi:hypothetical protein